MDRKDFLTRIEQIIDANPGTLQGTEALSDVSGWDSLAQVEFQAFLDEELHVEASPDRIAKCKTVEDLTNLADLPFARE